MNKIIWYLIISDMIIVSSFGLIAPIFALFLNSAAIGGSITAVGLASTIFFLVKGLVQLPLSKYIDSRRGKLGFLLGGTFVIVVVPFLYAYSNNITMIYLAQAIYGLGAAMAVPAWLSLFTMHLDAKHRGFEWSIWSVGVGLGTAVSAYIGALMATVLGFKILFFIVGGFSFLGFFVLLLLSKKFLRNLKETESFVLFEGEIEKKSKTRKKMS